ncbi:hypothetical protein TRAPUB_6278 [Trametes pubescens]|uniref:Uncharacterized protein n=1 Tax=Trametes pubescens TaxID=154538 RepID=A0A1M2V6F4_TRAPU|nr:hypothetical protein TRAPUB_6278 [Trametes pubescens]
MSPARMTPRTEQYKPQPGECPLLKGWRIFRQICEGRIRNVSAILAVKSEGKGTYFSESRGEWEWIPSPAPTETTVREAVEQGGAIP